MSATFRVAVIWVGLLAPMAVHAEPWGLPQLMKSMAQVTAHQSIRLQNSLHISAFVESIHPTPAGIKGA